MSMNDDIRLDLSKNFTDPMSWNDDIRLDLTKVFNDTMSMPDDALTMLMLNFTDPMSMNDDIRFDLSKNFTDPISMNDDIRLDLSKNFTDPFSWNDDITINLSKNFTDPFSWNDAINATVTFASTHDDAMSMPDDIRLDLSKNFTDPMSWNDDIRLDLRKVFNDTMSMPDQVLIMIMINFTDPMSMNDDIRLDFSKNIINPFSWTDDIRIDLTKVFNDTMSMPDDALTKSTLNFTDPFSWTDDINTVRTLIRPFDDPISWTDTTNFFITFASPPIIIPPTNVTVTGGAGGGVGGQPVPTIPDSDGDGFLDNVDACPLEPENFNGFQDLDGCPDIFDKPEPITIFDLGFPFGFNELDVVDDFINLETDSPQPQIEDLGIRWLGDEPITIESIIIGDSPFEFQIQDLPITFGNNRFGYTQEQIIYTVQETDNLCTNGFSVDCLDEITYEIPVQITGEVRGKTVVANGSITIDNTNRFNPYWLALILLVLIPIISFFLWKRKKTNPTTKTLLKVTQAPRTRTVGVTRSKQQKAGTTRKLITEPQKANVLGRKTK